VEQEVYLSNIITDDDLERIQTGSFNIIKAPIGCGKTTFMFDERILNFARARKHVLYLIHNKATRDFIAQHHTDKARVFIDNNYNGWFDKRRKGIWTSEEDEDYVHVMCYQTFAALLRNEGTQWLDDIDLIVWDEFDDIKGYYENEVKAIKKVLPEFSREKLVALIQEGRPTSVINFVYQIKTLILDPGRIRLLAVTATPEFAANYFRDYVNYVLTGHLENKYDALEVIFIDNVIDALKSGVLRPEPGRRYWCYTRYINDGLRIEVNASAVNFKTLMLWSSENKYHKDKYTEEKRRVTEYIKTENAVPEPYDFIITTGVLGRGVDIYDTSIQDWICDSDEYEDVVQSMRARFNPARRYLLESARGLVEFVQDGISTVYNEWHSLDELKELLTRHPIYSAGNSPQKLSTFNAVLKEYPDRFEKRRYGKNKTTQYRVKPVV